MQTQNEFQNLKIFTYVNSCFWWFFKIMNVISLAIGRLRHIDSNPVFWIFETTSNVPDFPLRFVLTLSLPSSASFSSNCLTPFFLPFSFQYFHLEKTIALKAIIANLISLKNAHVQMSCISSLQVLCWLPKPITCTFKRRKAVPFEVLDKRKY